MMQNTSPVVDQHALKASQATVSVLLLTAFVLGNRWVVLATAVAQLLGATGTSFAPFALLYRFVYRPLGLAANPQPDHHAPHRFASLVGGLFNAGGFVALSAGVPVLGWSLVWVVIVLANLNLWLGFCLGCWMYYQLNRLGVPGFKHSRMA
jgi:hypothetical protein